MEILLGRQCLRHSEPWYRFGQQGGVGDLAVGGGHQGVDLETESEADQDSLVLLRWFRSQEQPGRGQKAFSGG